MGSSCTCNRGENCEEIISNIFSTLLLKNLNVRDCCFEINTCVVKHKLDPVLYNNYICRLISMTEYKHAQADFFQNLLNPNAEDSYMYPASIRLVRLVLIFHSTGDLIDKVQLIENLINKYYDKTDNNIKRFLSDVVYINTELCITSFDKYIEADDKARLKEAFSKERRDRFIERLYTTYEEMKIKYEEAISNNISNNDKSLTAKFLSTSYYNLQGDAIRCSLYDMYLNEINSNDLIVN